MKKLIVFYAVFTLFETAFILLTYFFWNIEDDEGVYVPSSWQLITAKSIPVTIIGLFGIFNIWI